MDSQNLKKHLNSISMKQIKILIRQYNLHHKIKLSQNKPDLISDLLKHFETDIIDNKMISKKNDIEIPKIEELQTKPKIKKVVKKVVKEVVKEVIKPSEVKKVVKEVVKEVIKPSEVKKELDQLQQLWKSNMKTFLKDVDGDYDELLLHPVALRIKELRQLL